MLSPLLSLADKNVKIALTFSSSHKAMECCKKENRAASNNALEADFQSTV